MPVPALQLVNVANVYDSDNWPTLNLGGQSWAVATANAGGTTYLFASAVAESGLSVFSVAADGALTNVFNLDDNASLHLKGHELFATAQYGGETYLFVGSGHEGGVSLFKVGADGHLTNTANVADDATLNLNGVYAVGAATIGSATYFFGTGYSDDSGISVFSVGPGGTLTNVFNYPYYDPSVQLWYVTDMATTVVGGTTYLALSDYYGVKLLSVDTDGSLFGVKQVLDNATLNLKDSQTVTTALVGTTTYVFSAGYSDDGISAFSLASDGTLTNVANVSDDATLNLGGLYHLSTMVHDGTTYLLAVGFTDGGMSAFAVGTDGSLTPIANLSDDDTKALNGAVNMTSAVVGGHPLAFVAASYENGVGVFTLDHLPTATNLNQTLSYTEDTGPVAINDIVVADFDANDTITATLTLADPAVGSLTTTGGGTYVQAIGGWTVTGTVSEVNAALAAVSFVPVANNDVSTTITSYVEDWTHRGPPDGVISLNVTPVNDAPVAQDGVASGNQDTVIDGNLVATDVENSSLSYGRVANGAHGSATVNPDGSFSYMPALGYHGPDSFTFNAYDGSLYSNEATINITVTGSNVSPTAQDGAAGGDEDTTITGAVIAADIDSPSLVYSLVSNAAHGNVTVNADGTFSYTPDANYNGPDSFTFVANDGAVDSNVATENITINPINDAPVAQDGSASGSHDTVINGTLSGNDIDSPSLIFSRITGAVNGSVTVQSDGAFAYTPNPGYYGPDSFTFAAYDGAMYSNEATVSLTVVGTNVPPTAQDGAASGNEDIAITDTLVATDPDSPSLAFSRVSNSTHGDVTVHADGTFSYTPNANYSGSDSFTFKANDGALDSNIATVALFVNAVDDAPVIVSPTGNPAPIAVTENSTSVVTVVATDVDGPSTTYSIAGGADASKFQIDAGTGALSFVSAPSFEVPADTNHDNHYLVTVRASDGALFTDQQIDVTVQNVWEPFNWLGSGALGSYNKAWEYTGIGDFNGNGTADVLWREIATGRVDEWQMENGQWARSLDLGTHGPGWRVAGIGDFDGNGTSDVLWRDSTTGQLDIWLMANGQWWQSKAVGSHGADWKVLGVGDFDGDQTSDILFQNWATGLVDSWRMVGGNWAGSISLGSYDKVSAFAGIGDANADGISDVFWRNTITGRVDEWQMAHGNWARSIDLGSFNPAFRVAAVNDFNGDGAADILWHNPATGQVEGWNLVNGRWAADSSYKSFDAAYWCEGSGNFDHAGGADLLWHNLTTGQVHEWMLGQP